MNGSNPTTERRLVGTLRSWNDDRGFGFITPTQGGPELFVHISAFPKDGSRPTVGESLVYELGRGTNGKPQATEVYRMAIGRPTQAPRSLKHETGHNRALMAGFAGLALLVAAGAYGYNKYQQRFAHDAPRPQAPAVEPNGRAVPLVSPSNYRCDGRTYCSQMTSCSEAKFFLNNCPDTKMDGNNDGVPCEQQWCTSPFAK